MQAESQSEWAFIVIAQDKGDRRVPTQPGVQAKLR